MLGNFAQDDSCLQAGGMTSADLLSAKCIGPFGFRLRAGSSSRKERAAQDDKFEINENRAETL